MGRLNLGRLRPMGGRLSLVRLEANAIASRLEAIAIRLGQLTFIYSKPFVITLPGVQISLMSMPRWNRWQAPEAAPRLVLEAESQAWSYQSNGRLPRNTLQ